MGAVREQLVPCSRYLVGLKLSYLYNSNHVYTAQFINFTPNYHEKWHVPKTGTHVGEVKYSKASYVGL